MAHRSSHKHTIVWLWATHTTASSDLFGTAIRKIRARADMPQRIPNQRYLFEYLTTRCKMEPVTLTPFMARLYQSYRAFDDYVSHSNHPAGTPFPRDIGVEKPQPTDLSLKIREFVRVRGKVDFARVKMLAEFNDVWSAGMTGMANGLMVMNLVTRLAKLDTVRWPDNADVLNWEHRHKVQRTGT